MHSDFFEWDDAKAASNYRKHGVDFETASLVFDDPQRLDDLDEAHSNQELRYIAVGMADQHLITVSYTERGDRIRIISARMATGEEHDDYHREAQS